MSRGAASCAFLLLFGPAALAAQQVQTAVLPQTITVGDIFQVVIRVEGAGSGTVAFPDSLVLPADLEPAGRREVRVDTTASGPRWTAVYPVTGWRPGRHELASGQVVLAGGVPRTAAVGLPDVVIRSVLPADTAGVQPRPARDVLGGSRIWWPWLVLAGLLAAASIGLWYWRRRRRSPLPVPVGEAALPPRLVALHALDLARASRAVEDGDFKRFYSDVSAALRGYLNALDPALGLDLTTSELGGALRRYGEGAGATELRRLLEAADLVKFARRQPTAATALDEWQRARTWVESHDLPTPLARAA